MVDFDLHINKVLGVGGFGRVYHGKEVSRGIAVAVKKSRVSLHVKRTTLHYEACLLWLLQGHPAIPSLHGYGQFAHFEYLAMDLCGQSVKELTPQPHGTQLKTVIIVAQQMISALQHIHSHGIVHRDIKPDNILVSIQDPSRVVLVDYGISCPRNPGPTVQRYNPEAEHKNVTGTLSWASLNAHHGCHLSWRDDLESLAFTLFYLLRANLPWENLSQNMTTFGEVFVIRTLKTKWPGSKLANGFPTEFGRFLDETRDIGYDEIPPYMQYLDMFNALYSNSGFSDSNKLLDWSPATDCSKTENSLNVKPVKPVTPLLVQGQLISVQILAAPSILGFMPGDKGWDLDLTYDALPTQALPAVVLECSTDDDGFQLVTLAALKRGEAPRSDFSVRIAPPRSGFSFRIASGKGACGVKTVPPWPLDDTYCYVFPFMTLLTMQPFTVVENTVQSTSYCIRPQDLQKLKRGLSDEKLPVLEASEEKDQDAIRNMITRCQPFPILVRVTPLDPGSKAVDWTSERAWFDEVVAMSKQRSLDDVLPWSTGTQDVDPLREVRQNSYYGVDMRSWANIQGERDITLTLAELPPDLENTQPDTAMPRINQILATHMND